MSSSKCNKSLLPPYLILVVVLVVQVNTAEGISCHVCGYEGNILEDKNSYTCGKHTDGGYDVDDCGDEEDGCYNKLGEYLDGDFVEGSSECISRVDKIRQCMETVPGFKFTNGEACGKISRPTNGQEFNLWSCKDQSDGSGFQTLTDDYWKHVFDQNFTICVCKGNLCNAQLNLDV